MVTHAEGGGWGFLEVCVCVASGRLRLRDFDARIEEAEQLGRHAVALVAEQHERLLGEGEAVQRHRASRLLEADHRPAGRPLRVQVLGERLDRYLRNRGRRGSVFSVVFCVVAGEGSNRYAHTCVKELLGRTVQDRAGHAIRAIAALDEPSSTVACRTVQA